MQARRKKHTMNRNRWIAATALAATLPIGVGIGARAESPGTPDDGIEPPPGLDQQVDVYWPTVDTDFRSPAEVPRQPH